MTEKGGGGGTANYGVRTKASQVGKELKENKNQQSRKRKILRVLIRWASVLTNGGGVAGTDGGVRGQGGGALCPGERSGGRRAGTRRLRGAERPYLI